MTGEKKFRTSLFGYKKKDVYDYVEKLARDLEEQIRSKDSELANLKNQNKYLISQNEEMTAKLRTMESDRSFIADAIIKAQEQAKMIVEGAIREAEEQKIALMAQTEAEKMKFLQVKDELRKLRLNAIEAISKYESELKEYVSDIRPDDESEGLLEAAAAQEECTDD